MTFVAFLPFGILLGAVARMLTPRTRQGGWGMSMLIGAAGALLGGFVGRFVPFSGEEPRGFVASLLGAAAFVVAYQVDAVRRSSARS